MDTKLFNDIEKLSVGQQIALAGILLLSINTSSAFLDFIEKMLLDVKNNPPDFILTKCDICGEDMFIQKEKQQYVHICPICKYGAK